MNKKWADLSESEKIEELRKDMLRTMRMVNSWVGHARELGELHNSLTKQHTETSSQLSQALIRIANLEARKK